MIDSDIFDLFRDYHRCANPLCKFIVPTTTIYCCMGCDLAHQGGYEIHEDGPLGHEEWCARRHPRLDPEAEAEAEYRAYQASLPSGRRNLTTTEIERLREEQR